MLTVIMITGCAIGATIVIWKRNAAKRQTREAGWAIALLWAAACLQSAIALHLPISLPTDWISMLFEPVYVPIVEWVKG